MRLDDAKLERKTRPVLGISVDVLTWQSTVARIVAWASSNESRSVCLCNVHSLVTARRDPIHRNALSGADMVLPDGEPIAWMLRRHGCEHQIRISGPDLMLRCCAEAAQRGISMFLYGGTALSLASLDECLRKQFPSIQVVGRFAPPFRPLTRAEDDEVICQIEQSGAQLIWVGIGCPKQEAWLHEHRGRLRGVMLGVGAAFDILSGTTSRAPLWMQRRGLEWLYRLARDPARLARRYIVGNTVFLWAVAGELLRSGRPPQTSN